MPALAPSYESPIFMSSCMYDIKFVFSPINLSYVNFIIRPAKEPRREKGKSFPPLCNQYKND